MGCSWRRAGLGRVVAAGGSDDGGGLLGDADVAYTGRARLEANGDGPPRPELVFLIRSPEAPWRPMMSRVFERIDAGVDRVGVVDLATRTIRLYSGDAPETVVGIDGVLDLSPVLEGFRVPAREILDGSMDVSLLEAVRAIFYHADVDREPTEWSSISD